MKKILGISIILCLSILPVSHAMASGTISISPETITLPAVGESFTVEIAVNDVNGIGGFQFDLNYDPAIIAINNKSDVSLSNYMQTTGRTVSLLGPDIDNKTGLLETGAFSFGKQNGPSGNGALMQVTFTVLSLGKTSIDLKDVTLTDISANPITLDKINGGKIILPPVTN
ncbi:Cohesin domain-containing protein [Desulfonema limicola]|uniref:Cohesin domain-containing protein n=1 Tax=Desulfonema limicola TaxID=45656 RepID=A0A975GIR9_9BACT|nr:cohesin domain-containing protein [Desulfonema limicola]QTA82228.1 Cohesin domain-containing protein [Desulfonema limicola]